jgi:hypothetical protein
MILARTTITLCAHVDVFLINFFTDSSASEKEWRVINSYMKNLEEKGQYEATIDSEVLQMAGGSTRVVQDFEQNRTAYSCICEELKQLYTAFTRATPPLVFTVCLSNRLGCVL